MALTPAVHYLLITQRPLMGQFSVGKLPLAKSSLELPQVRRLSEVDLTTLPLMALHWAGWRAPSLDS